MMKARDLGRVLGEGATGLNPLKETFLQQLVGRAQRVAVMAFEALLQKLLE
jgi:hypothetical protein